MRWLLISSVLLLSACRAWVTPSSFHAPPLQPGEVLLTGDRAVDWQWHEPPNYSFTLQGGPVFVTLGGVRTHVVVRNHRVVEPHRGAAERLLFPTIAELQKQAEAAAASGAFVAVVWASDGRPTFVYIDDPTYIDEEYRVSLTEFAAD